MGLTSPFPNRDSALNYLYGRINYERTVPPRRDWRELKLQRMEELLSRLGNPHAALPVIHVAGTKGKGSTAVMIASVLSAAGFRTGLFTSPHLQSPEERMKVDGRLCPADRFVELLDRVRREVIPMDSAADERGETGPTYFEIITAMAMLHFATSSVDVAVLEVGRGGS